MAKAKKKKVTGYTVKRQRVKTNGETLTDQTITNVKNNLGIFTGTTKIKKKKVDVVHQYSDCWKVK